MINFKTLEKVKWGARITYYNGIYAFILGILYIAFFEFILKTNFSALKIVWDVFSQYNPGISYLLVKLVILKGVLVIAISIIIMYLSSYIYRKKERISWLILLIIGIVFWPSLLVMEFLDKNIWTIILASIGWISFLIGILIPVRYYIIDVQESY
ncbi:MAG: hypothetical protein QXO70_01125 [Candidatus Pacearchaeota archaeon]